MNQPTDGAFSVNVTEEQLDIQRETVDTGRPLRLRKQVQDVPTVVKQPLNVQTVHIERVPKGRVVDELPVVRQEGDVTVVPVIEERLVTRKELVLVEEIRLTRQRQVVQGQAEVSLRREHVVVERFDPGSGQWLPEPGDPDAAAQPSPNRSD